MEYKRFYIQKDNDNPVDVLETYGVYIKSFPFKLPDPKEFAKTEWLDQDGDDEFIPENPRYKAMEVKIKFVYTGGRDTFNSKVLAFWKFLQGCEFKIYDEYTMVGKQKVRYVSYDPESFYRRDKDVVEFSMTFKINDPITNIVLNV